MSIRRANRSGSVALLCFEDSSNFGDQLIGRLARSQLSLAGVDDFEIINARRVVVDLREFAAVVVGPGGYFSGKHERDDRPDVRWFLDLSASLARDLADAGVPLYFWATGVNAWSERRPFDADAVSEIRGVLESSTAIFVRGHADLDFLRDNVWSGVDQKARFLPCPSLFAKRLLGLPDRRASSMVGINVAPDQISEWSAAPVDDPESWFAQQFGPVIQHISACGFQPVFVANTRSDSWFCETHFPSEPVLMMNDRGAMLGEGMVEWLGKFHCVIGMRLHGWLPYVGAGVPSILISPFPIRQQMPLDLGLPASFGTSGPFDSAEVIGCFDSICNDYESVSAHADRIIEKEWSKAETVAAEVSQAIATRASNAEPLTITASASYWEDRGKRLRNAKLYAAAIDAYERSGTMLGRYQAAMCRVALGDVESALPLFRSVTECESLAPDLDWIKDAAAKHIERLKPTEVDPSNDSNVSRSRPAGLPSL